MTRITVVTACRNAEGLIGETVSSILEQTALTDGRAELEYLIRDGASTDGTCSIVEGFRSTSINLISAPDDGMYSALAAGLREATGEIVCYLNAGDYFHKCAFDVVLEVMEGIPKVDWLTGYAVFYNIRSQVMKMSLPYRLRPANFQNGLHGTVLPTLQQESTFWRRTLHDEVDFEALARFRLAGDYYLWRQFAKVACPYIVSAYLGGFRQHLGQLSEAHEEYVAELRRDSRDFRILEWVLAWLELPIWKYAPPGVKRRLNSRRHIMWDTGALKWTLFSE